ncbi:hypothetical protein [Xanthomonas campestris]|uniref:hypothetical protein n=1 Tax=Xanthomonas campestris TaxID=339 RepID=UPI0011D191C7|nr:hypothetical protein [Xanthomonas campestris]MEA9776269.1 hypothetical protein [Xanthomonas campestris pv. raphani]MEA9918014.1 hypothetical protein [Xanthomonas campestris pv. raphani]
MNNSASNLLAILESCRQQPKHLSCADTWKNVLAVDSNEKLIGALGEFFYLTEAAANEVLAVHADKSSVEYWKVRIINGFYSANLGSKWQEFIQNIDDVTIFTLRTHAALLDLKRPARNANFEELAAIGLILEEAARLLMELELSDEAKEILLSRIEQLQSLLRRYRFVSPSAVLDSAKVLAAEISIAEKEEPEVVRNSKFYTTIKDGLGMLADATQVASAKPIFVGTTTYLLGLFS